MKFIFLLAFALFLSSELYGSSTSFAVQPKPAPTTPLKAMEIEGNVSVSSKRVRDQLKDLAEQVKQNKDVIVYIISYSRSAYPKEAKRRANLIRNYLVEKLQVEPDRIVTVDGGSRKTRKIDIYFVPAKAREPKEDTNVNTNEIQDSQASRKKQQWRAKQPAHPNGKDQNPYVEGLYYVVSADNSDERMLVISFDNKSIPQKANDPDGPTSPGFYLSRTKRLAFAKAGIVGKRVYFKTRPVGGVSYEFRGTLGEEINADFDHTQLLPFIKGKLTKIKRGKVVKTENLKLGRTFIA